MKKIIVLCSVAILIIAAGAVKGENTQYKNDKGLGIGASFGIQNSSNNYSIRSQMNGHISLRKYLTDRYGLDVGFGHSYNAQGNSKHRFGIDGSLLVRIRNKQNVNVNFPIGFGLANYPAGGKHKTDFGFTSGLEIEYFPFVSNNDDARLGLRFNLGYSITRDNAAKKWCMGFNAGQLGFSYYFGTDEKSTAKEKKVEKVREPEKTKMAEPVEEVPEKAAEEVKAKPAEPVEATPEKTVEEVKSKPAVPAEHLKPAQPDLSSSFVIIVDGKEYGPVDVPTIRIWLNENRISENDVIRDYITKDEFKVGDLK